MFYLRQAHDGHYYARGRYAWSGFITYQLHSSAAAWLEERHGVKIGETITDGMMQRMVERGWATTGRSGTRQIERKEADPGSGASDHTIQLAVAEGESDWILQLCLPELPQDYVASMPSPGTALSESSLIIEPGPVVVPAIRLWPGMGGYAVKMSPIIAGYSVSAAGAWPDGWLFAAKEQRVRGLEEGGTVFAGEERSGVRLEPLEALVAGETYRLVGRHVCLPLPLDAQDIGSNSGWRAWEFVCPPPGDRDIDKWAQGIGHPIWAPRFRLAVASPPRAYTASGVPVLSCGDVCLVVLRSESPFATLPQEGLHVTAVHRPNGSEGPFTIAAEWFVKKVGSAWRLPVSEPGWYRVYSSPELLVPTDIILSKDEPLVTNSYCQPLKMVMVGAQMEVGVEAFRLTASVKGIDRDELRRVEAIKLSPNSEHIVFEVRDGLDRSLGRCTRVASDCVEERVLALLRTMLGEPEDTWDQTALVDVGAYGLVGVRTAQEVRGDETVGRSVSQELLERATWLSLALRTEPGPMVPVPRQLRESMSVAFSGVRACRGLTEMDLVPSWGLPHLAELARRLVLARETGSTAE